MYNSRYIICNWGLKMYSLLVLGYIPGTNIQISFQAWLIMLVVLPVIIKLSWPRLWPKLKPRLDQVVQAALTLTAAYLASDTMRQPLHASQLHQRVS